MKGENEAKQKAQFVNSLSPLFPFGRREAVGEREKTREGDVAITGGGRQGHKLFYDQGGFALRRPRRRPRSSTRPPIRRAPQTHAPAPTRHGHASIHRHTVILSKNEDLISRLRSNQLSFWPLLRNIFGQLNSPCSIFSKSAADYDSM